MRRRDCLRALGASAAAGALAKGCSTPQAGRGPRRPDVLLIMTDQFNPACTGYAGEPIIRTPHLDRLAREGAAFDTCYTNCPVCMPARLTIRTGREPRRVARGPSRWLAIRGVCFGSAALGVCDRLLAGAKFRLGSGFACNTQFSASRDREGAFQRACVRLAAAGSESGLASKAGAR